MTRREQWMRSVSSVLMYWDGRWADSSRRPSPSTIRPRSQTHPVLHRPGRDRCRTCLTRHLRTTDRHVWHASPASSPTALPAVSQRSRRVHLPRIRRRVVAAARAKLSPNLVDRQTAAMDAWHRDGACDRLRELRVPTLVATGSEDIVIPAPNALALVNAIPGAWLAQFKGGGMLSWLNIHGSSRILSMSSSRSERSATSIITARKTLERHGPLACPGLPAFADWFCVVVEIDLFQPLSPIFYRFGGAFVFFLG